MCCKHDPNPQPFWHMKYGRLTTRTMFRQGYRKYWVCVCDCGNVVARREDALKAGDSASCGCLHAELNKVRAVKHGGTGNGRWTPEYTTWKGMLSRCRNPRSRSWENYGGRGITVDDRWASSFQNFLDDMGPRPDGHSIERINNDAGYSKENCKWATRTEQNNNTRRSRKNKIIAGAV